MEQQQTPLSPAAKFCKLAELGRIDVRTNTVIRFGDTETTVETHILSAVLNEHVEMRRIVVDTILPRTMAHKALGEQLIEWMKPDPFKHANFAAAVEVNRELSRKLAVAEAEKNLAEMTLNSQAQKLEEAERLIRESRSREGNLINERDIAVGRLRNETSELRRKLEVAEKQLHAARQDSLNLTLEARDAPELRRKLAEEVGKVLVLLGERDKAIQDRNEAIAERNAATRLADAIRSERDRARAMIQKIKEALL